MRAADYIGRDAPVHRSLGRSRGARSYRGERIDRVLAAAIYVACGGLLGILVTLGVVVCG